MAGKQKRISDFFLSDVSKKNKANNASTTPTEDTEENTRATTVVMGTNNRTTTTAEPTPRESSSADVVWTTDDLRRLLNAMKQNISPYDTNCIHTKGLKCLNWEMVAFQPYSPEICRRKWQDISQKIRKVRSLTELIVEAEGAIDTPFMNINYVNTDSPPTCEGEFLQTSSHEEEQHPEGPETSTVQPNPSLDSRALRPGSMPVKRRINGYNIFCSEQWISLKGVSSQKRPERSAQLWRQLPQRQKDEYSMRSRQLRGYEVELSSYLSGDENGAKKRRYTKKEKPIRIFPGEPKMAPRSGYSVFLSERMSMQDKTPHSSLAPITTMWGKLSANEKQSYHKKAEDNVRKNAVELEKWFKTLTAQEQADYHKHNRKKCVLFDVPRPLQECPKKYRPSDSEDEDIEDSSEEEEEEEEDSDSEGEEEEEDAIMFWMH